MTHAEGRRRDPLIAIHRENAAPDDLCTEGRFVEREAEHGGGEAVELDADRRKRVVKKHELQKLGRAPDEPDVCPGRGAHRSKAGEAQQGKPKPQQEPPCHRQRGDFDCEQRSVPEEGLKNIAQQLVNESHCGARTTAPRLSSRPNGRSGIDTVVGGFLTAEEPENYCVRISMGMARE